MPSVSSIAVGANMAAAAASKARHGMNENIARLSTGIRAMYGGDAAGHSVGTAVSCLLYTSPSPRDRTSSRMPSSA